MAADVVGLMRALGHERFAVVGHDRGAMVAFRAALDHPERVERLVVMDSVPLVEALERADWRFARDWWHWWFLGQTAEAGGSASSAPIRTAGTRPTDPRSWATTRYADLWAALRDPAVVHGMCEDYRAGLTVDREHDEADRARRPADRVPDAASSMRSDDDIEAIYGDPLAVWRPWVSGSLDGRAIDSGHHQAEEAPEELAAALLAFLG